MDAENLHPNAQLMLGLATAWNAGDVEKFMGYLGENPTYRRAGRNPLSGTYRGRHDIERLTQRILEMSDHTLKVEPLDILANDRNAVVLYRLQGERNGKVLDVTVALASEFGADGKITRNWDLASDQRSFDEFFG